jgi:hypothetical protein
VVFGVCFRLIGYWQIALHYSNATDIFEGLLRAGAEPHRRFQEGSLVDLALGMPHARLYMPALLSRHIVPLRAPSSPESSLLVIARLYDIEAAARQELDASMWEAISSNNSLLLDGVAEHGIKPSTLRKHDGQGALHVAIILLLPLPLIEYLLKKGNPKR